MPLERITGKAALERLKTNSFVSWPSRSDADNRIEPMTRPAFRPGFTLAPGSRVFTIGSCFARNVEDALAERGFDVPSLNVFRRIPEFAQLNRAAINNYGVGAIYNEIAWALDEATPFVPEQNFFELFPGKFIDVHLPRAVRPAAFDVVRERRRRITAFYREIIDCPLIIITLGLAENWYDIESGLYLNIRPHRLMLEANPDRYELHVLNYSDTITLLTRTFRLLDEHCRSDKRVLLTVSPVPLNATHRDMDVATANTYSKSVLRAATEEIVATFDYVDYYPSFESIVLSRRDLAFEDDQIHVRPELVELNVSRMIAAYVDAEEAGGASADNAILEQIRSGRAGHKKVVEFFDKHPGILESDTELLAIYCDACLAIDEVAKAGAVLHRLPDDWNPERTGLLTARWLLAGGKPREAVAQCRKLLGLNPHKGLARRLWLILLEATIAMEGGRAGLATLEAWRKAQGRIKRSEPFRLVAVALAEAGEDADAEAMFNEAFQCEAGPSDAALINFADFLTRRGREAEAEALVEKLV